MDNQNITTRRIAVYPGSFDPITNGHLDIARRAARLFDMLIIAVYANPRKALLFSLEERLSLCRAVVKSSDLPNVRVESFTGLTVDYVSSLGGQAIVRGLRSPNDFEGEFQMGLMNHRLAPAIETVCLFTNQEHLFVSSSRLKEVASLGGDASGMLPSVVVEALHQKFTQ
ncbi:pantetheine-phosphate adenylyltransferase [Dictyobacter formicarum]|uniref:Phosphopantetheine adenylyltransferase n=1 Tax=Dictyobacter formicarum TaxID=2778368 RepID=A0ABQ3VUI0_9CHLR|nr:pantetheine-phosphate adenylyltransferase [Dictyobacter formicarum]GHO89213.1 phosphopantetheine adenylyltransferase [Dictyobacter formicarum]